MMKQQALVVVDVQKDFVEGGSLAVAGGQTVANHLANWAIPALVKLSVPVLYTKDWHIDPGTHFSDAPDYIDSWPRHCVAGSMGASFAAEFPPTFDVFYKGQYSASYSGAEAEDSGGNKLSDALRQYGVKIVNVVGIAFDYCVKETAIDLAKEGFRVFVIHSLTASVHPRRDEKTIRELREAGVSVVRVEEAL